MEIEENISLSSHNSFRLPSRAKWFCEVENKEELSEAIDFSRKCGAKPFVLGSGTNIVLTGNLDGLVIRNKIKGSEFKVSSATVCSGENWHKFVGECRKRYFGGLENLALIPGTVGAAPIQNIGAYGVELSDRFESMEAQNLYTNEVSVFSKEDCEFGYRKSLFTEDKEWFVLNVSLNSSPEVTVDYPDIREYLEANKLEACAATVYEATCSIRRRKLPDIEKYPNAGSFFKNPIISKEICDGLLKEFPMIPNHSVSGGIKVSAAWLIDSLGLKGIRIGGFSVSQKHALVIINSSNGVFDELNELCGLIKSKVFGAYNVCLEVEPEIFPFRDL
ncbi:MAG: UDP-N-acetylenolpyruvoylglucosamine reductase [Gammaproteobacteria bacterium]|nr:UDP-N-acetylenolpyruvoylglucosamine reductase [Gammaproteobacteria bacterium]